MARLCSYHCSVSGLTISIVCVCVCVRACVCERKREKKGGCNERPSYIQAGKGREGERQSITLLECSQASPARPSGNSDMK